MLADYVTSAIATLLVVADPLLMSALFLGITHGMSKAHRREVALRASIIAFCILLAAGLGGALGAAQLARNFGWFAPSNL